MRFIVKFSFPVEKFNEAVRDGTAGAKIKEILDDIKPESVYFWEEDGKRGGIMTVHMDNPSQIPSIAEPLFQRFNAAVYFHPCMTAEELASAGLDAMAKKYR